jgi:hypothetical protein
MTYLRSAAAGVAASVFAVAVVLCVQVLTVALRMAWESRSSASGGIGFVTITPGLPVMIAAVVGFGLGFWWVRRKR